MGLAALIQGLSLTISGLVYALIPAFYRMFEKLSIFKFMSNKDIHNVWNNIYVLIGVIVLFAIAIKLISAIVNPDTLTDNKKGAKTLYFRSVLAVVFIFIIPILFDYSYKLQQKLIESDFLISRVFGYKISEDTDVGQLLAWTTFSSFCQLGDDPNNEDIKAYEKAEADITDAMPGLIMQIEKSDTFGNPLKILNSDAGSTTENFKYHQLLCPLAGFLVLYELCLLNMDTLFRAAKIAFLELMLPIVLGAFVFEADILKKWAKEFVSTYITLFLKVLAIGFMVISLVKIKGYIAGDNFFQNENWFMSGLFYTFLLIGTLQLVKKIPDLINSIFGVQIKSAGGIKGRLGEMAGIGGIAQKAWTSLGTGAKNLGKAAFLGAAAAPAVGAFLGANAWYKSKHGGKSIMDTEAFRKGKGILYGARSAVKTGSPMSAYQEYEKMSAPPQHTREELMKIRARAAKNLDNKNVTHDGTWTNERRDANGNVQHLENGKTDFKNRAEILNDLSETQKQAHQTFDGTKMGRQLNAAIDSGNKAQIKYNDILGVQKQGENLVSMVEGINNKIQTGEKYTASEKQRASEIYDRLNKGDRILEENDANFLRKYMNSSQADQFKTTVSRYDDAFQTALQAHSELTTQDLASSGALAGTLANAKAEVDKAKAAQQDAVDKMSDADKTTYQYLSGIMEQQAAALATTNAFNAAAPTDLLKVPEIDPATGNVRRDANNNIVYASKSQQWATTTWATDPDVGSGIKGADSSSPSPAPTPQPGQGQEIEIVETAGNGPRVNPDELDPNSEPGMVKRVNELREKRAAGKLTPAEIEELNDKISTIRRMQRDRHGNNN